MLIEIATQNDQIASTLLCPPVSPSRLSVNFWTTVSEAVCTHMYTYLIFVTTITTAGCVKDLAKYKFFQLERKKLLYTQFCCQFQMQTFLSSNYGCVKKISGMADWLYVNTIQHICIYGLIMTRCQI